MERSPSAISRSAPSWCSHDWKEKRVGRIENDLTIPYVRNIMGPMSFTIIKFDRSVGSWEREIEEMLDDGGQMEFRRPGQ